MNFPKGTIYVNVLTGILARAVSIAVSFLFIGIANRNLAASQAASVASLTGILAVTNLAQIGIGSTVLRYFLSNQFVTPAFLTEPINNAVQALRGTSGIAMAISGAGLLYALNQNIPALIVTSLLALAASYTASLQVAEWALMASRRSYVTQTVNTCVSIGLLLLSMTFRNIQQNYYGLAFLIYSAPILSTLIIHNVSVLRSYGYGQLYINIASKKYVPKIAPFGWGTLLSLSSAIFDASIMWISLMTSNVELKHVLMFRLIYAASSALQVLIQPAVMHFVDAYKGSEEPGSLWMIQIGGQAIFAVVAFLFTFFLISPAIEMWTGEVLNINLGERVTAASLAALWPTLSWSIQLTFYAKSASRAGITMAFCAATSGLLLMALFLTHLVENPLTLLVGPILISIISLILSR